jgi:hypothetical protein
MTFIIYVILYYIFLYSEWKKLQQMFQNTLQVVIYHITPSKHEKKRRFFQESKS